MIKKLIIIFFTLLFAMQSISSVLDIYQVHDKDEMGSLLGFDIAQQESVQKEQLSSTTEKSFHHCCHCHSSAQFFVYISSLYSKGVPPINELFEYNFKYLSTSVLPKLRPPIV